MDHAELMARVVVSPGVCGGMPCVRGTRIPIAIILDSLAEGCTAEQLMTHFPSLTADDIRGALAYAGSLTRGAPHDPTGDPP